MIDEGIKFLLIITEQTRSLFYYRPDELTLHLCHKQKITPEDISAAYVQAQLKKLPCIFLTGGELNKQAKIILEKLETVKVKKI